MSVTGKGSPTGGLAEFQARIAALAEEQKRACVLLAARGLMGEMAAGHQPAPTWHARSGQKLSQLIQSAIHNRRGEPQKRGAPLPEEPSTPVIDAEYHVLDK